MERNSQKAILIGKQGQMLKQIGILARKELEEIWGAALYLDLWVKVSPAWREKSITCVILVIYLIRGGNLFTLEEVAGKIEQTLLKPTAGKKVAKLS